MTRTPRMVIVGAGLAAAKAVEALREQGFDGTITLIGDEPHGPYERPPLSKGLLLGTSTPEDAFVHPDHWYREHGVDTRFGEAAVAIDRDARTVMLSSGSTVDYERLLLATGSRPRPFDVPGMELDGVTALRTLADSERIRTAFATATSLVVIGAGWIGLETAAAARSAGLAVTVVEQAGRPLRGIMGAELSEYFVDLHRRHGVDVLTSTSVTALQGDGRVNAVRVGRDSIPADLVVIGVGIVPNVELAAECGLAVDDGIRVDERLRTSDPSVFAAGDVANAHNTALGASLRVEHWDNAIRQGRLAAHTLLDQEGRYDWQPYFFTDQYDLGMEYVGHGAADDTVVVRGDRASGEFIAFWLRDGVVTAGMNVNVWDVNDDLRALLGRRVDAARLADVDIALTAL